MDLMGMLKQLEIGQDGPSNPAPTSYNSKKSSGMLEAPGISDQFGNPVKSDKSLEEENLLYKFLMKLRGEQRGLASDVQSPNPEMHPDIINGAPGMKFRLPL